MPSAKLSSQCSQIQTEQGVEPFNTARTRLRVLGPSRALLSRTWEHWWLWKASHSIGMYEHLRTAYVPAQGPVFFQFSLPLLLQYISSSLFLCLPQNLFSLPTSLFRSMMCFFRFTSLPLFFTLLLMSESVCFGLSIMNKSFFLVTLLTLFL